MGIDRESKPGYINIVVPDNKKILQMMKDKAEQDGQNEEDKKHLVISSDTFHIDTDEFYYDNEENEIHYSGGLQSLDGDGYIGFTLPLSDEILIDILQAAIKKLNKLKVAMESLK